ncbi:MAG: VOC family protein [Lacrimispora celerecrescens]|nr:VOC family protein [Lacrimispora celerecrescens]
MWLGAIVLDSGNSEELSDFYQKLLGWTKERQFFEDETWIIVKSSEGQGTPLVFQEVSDYAPPKWPAVKGVQQQMLHLDFYVKEADLDKEVSRAISCGAVLSEIQLSESWKVMLDPAGHPFCIIPLPPK